MKEDVCKLIAQIESIRTLKDGGAKLTLGFGLESFDEMKKLLEWSQAGEQLFAVVLTPVKHNAE